MRKNEEGGRRRGRKWQKKEEKKDPLPHSLSGRGGGKNEEERGDIKGKGGILSSGRDGSGRWHFLPTPDIFLSLSLPRLETQDGLRDSVRGIGGRRRTHTKRKVPLSCSGRFAFYVRKGNYPPLLLLLRLGCFQSKPCARGRASNVSYVVCVFISLKYLNVIGQRNPTGKAYFCCRK